MCGLRASSSQGKRYVPLCVSGPWARDQWLHELVTARPSAGVAAMQGHQEEALGPGPMLRRQGLLKATHFMARMPITNGSGMQIINWLPHFMMPTL